MDFYRILEVETKDRNTRKDVIEIVPDFQVCRSQDLMIRGKKFYAIWDEQSGLWSTDEYDVQRLVDQDIYSYAKRVEDRIGSNNVKPKLLGNFSTGLWNKFIQYSSNLSDNSHQLDERITFHNSEVRKEDYVSKRLLYSLSEGSIDAYSELFGTLFEREQLDKLEWAIGAVLSGDAREIQKFIVLYGPAGAGKSTLLKLVEQLFDGYIATFDAKALTSNSNAFSTEVFRDNPLVAIQHDGDLSRIEDNTKLNSIVSHEDMTMNEKYKASYTSKINAFLFMGSNKAVKITDAKSGLIRRLIDVHPSGRKIPERRYHLLMSQLRFELGAIAHHCLERYREMGRDYYSSYRPIEMMLQTDVFFNFIEHYYDIFSEEEGIALTHAYTLYKQYCQEALIEYRMPQYRFREELKNYFREFHERYDTPDGERHRSYYTDFIGDHFEVAELEEKPMALILDKTDSLIDHILSNEPAQYAKMDGTPTKYWSNRERMIGGELKEPDPSQVCSTVLADLDTSKEHYVKPQLQHIVIDFDLKDENGDKSAELNLEAASKWPPTYAEYSRGGSGVHLHYFYEGDPTELSRIYGEDIEVKIFVGDSSLRRRLTYCNDIPVATINKGLPLKEKKMLSDTTLKDEKALRNLIARNLRKEIHPATKPSMDFINKILDDAYESGLSYDVTDMRSALMSFANNSTNQAIYCLRLLKDMKLVGKEVEGSDAESADAPEVIFDVEVFPNLFLVNWKYRGVPDSMVRMINPSPAEIEALTKMRLIGYNNRRYDNHILYGRILGYNNYQLYELSKKLIDNNVRNAYFGEAYNLSYADIYDFASTKQGLKKWQIELGLQHMESRFDWDEPVPEENWPEVSEYCDNDVYSTEEVLDHLDADFNARKMLAEISGLPVNETTQRHAAKIIFEGERNPQGSFNYTDLSERFPGYSFDMGQSFYRDEAKVGEGGYVYAEPGMYENVGVLDVASMHPTSIVELDLFGPYTKNFKALMDARLAIKRGEFESARKMFDGKLAPFMANEDQAEDLSYALKIIINSVYGLTAAKFDNPFRDNRNKDNIVAKRGALFMIDLKNFVQDHGYQVIHIKTDSIKIPNIDQKIIDLVMEFGQDYGYEFEHEATFERMCLVNDAVYVAKVLPGRKPAHWEAVGAQFKHPYVFKRLFSREPLNNRDLCETKSVTTAMYLDFTPETDTPMALLPDNIDDEHLHFVGRAGSFVPVNEGGGYLLREKDGKLHSVGGAKDFKWREEESVTIFDDWDKVDYVYFNRLADEAVDAISKYGDFEWFVGDSFADERVSELTAA